MSLDRAQQLVQKVEQTTQSLARAASLLDPPPLATEPWHQTLVTKVRPQLEQRRFLIVAVVGGTNIGKSAVFNHIAGQAASRVDKRAAGTKHPVLLVPDGFGADAVAELFPSFALRPWERGEDPIEASEEDRLFWRTSAATPKTLLVLDTPDVDSDQPVNWDRADRVRRAADVLVCVLTQQKYNDRAVKEFFRRAAAEGKQTVVVFNQILLPDDEDIWPDWVGTFCEATGLEPSRVYLAPHDRKAVEELRLPFYERAWPPAPIGERSDTPHRLLDDLSSLHFETIKLETMQGALAQIAREAPGWLDDVRAAAGEFGMASQQLRENELAQVRDWPQLPASLMTQELMAWWRAQREGFSRKVHGFYAGAADLISQPFRMLAREQEDPFEAYRRREWNDGVQRALAEMFDRLEFLERSGHERLRPQLAKLLSGQSRQKLLADLKVAHDAVDIEADLAELVQGEMNAFREANPSMHATLRTIDKATAAAKPLITVGLFAVGAGPIVDVGVAGTMTHLVGDVAGGTVITVAGEKLLSEGGKEGFGRLQAQIQALHTKFVAQRIGWLTRQLREQFLGDFPEQIQSAATIGQSEAFAAAEAAIAELDTFVSKQQQTGVATVGA